MKSDELIAVEDFCQFYDIEASFILSLEDSGLIEIARSEESSFIPYDEMPRIEKFMRMHYDLNINIEGLETIDYLLRKMESLQDELNRMRSRFHDL